MVPHSSTLAWKIPWMEEPGRLQSMVSLRVRHDWVTSLSLFTFMHWRRKWQPTPVFLPGESQGRGTWWATVYGVTQSWTRLKWLSIALLPMLWILSLVIVYFCFIIFFQDIFLAVSVESSSSAFFFGLTFSDLNSGEIVTSCSLKGVFLCGSISV